MAPWDPTLHWDQERAPCGRAIFGDTQSVQVNTSAAICTRESITPESGLMTWRFLVEHLGVGSIGFGVVGANCQDLSHPNPMWMAVWKPMRMDATWEAHGGSCEAIGRWEGSWGVETGDVVEVSFDPISSLLAIKVDNKGTTTRRLVGDVSEVHPAVFLSSHGQLGPKIRILERCGTSKQELEWQKSGRAAQSMDFTAALLQEIQRLREDLRASRHETKTELEKLATQMSDSIAATQQEMKSSISALKTQIEATRQQTVTDADRTLEKQVTQMDNATAATGQRKHTRQGNPTGVLSKGDDVVDRLNVAMAEKIEYTIAQSQKALRECIAQIETKFDDVQLGHQKELDAIGTQLSEKFGQLSKSLACKTNQSQCCGRRVGTPLVIGPPGVPQQRGRLGLGAAVGVGGGEEEPVSLESRDDETDIVEVDDSRFDYCAVEVDNAIRSRVEEGVHEISLMVQKQLEETEKRQREELGRVMKILRGLNFNKETQNTHYNKAEKRTK